MGKISPVSIKYMIHAKFTAQGALEKPDVIGALFGQTEGLLGSELEMRELQKEGKIGRIEVSLETSDGKTLGEIEIPSSLDQSETTIIAAAIETIERIGPSDAEIKVEKIEDVRSNKREYIIERAKKLMAGIEGGADSRDIGDAVKTSSRTSKIQEYGTERLASGDISGDEIIIVEGRADVINLLKNGVNNVIAMSGTQLPETIIELSKEKTTTLFVDGDRGGMLIAKNVCGNAEIDYIVVAPDGKEVEELTGKEILSLLRKKVKADEFFKKSDRTGRSRNTRDSLNRRRDNETISEAPINKRTKELTKTERDKIKEMVLSLEGSKSAYLLDSDLNTIKKVSSGEISSNLNRNNGRVFAVVLDGTATPPIIKAAESNDCGYLIAKNFAYADNTDVKLISI
jgi:DNA primase